MPEPNTLTQFGGLAYDQLTMQQQLWNQQELAQIQHNYNLQYQENQFENQQALNQQGHDLQFDMWNKTNYGAQMKHLKDAGLNPSLMYQQGGQGGQTGSQTGGNAGGQNAGLGMAPQAPEFKLFGAQEALMKEQARLARIEGDKKAGVDTELTKSQTANNNMDTELKKIKKQYADKGYIEGNTIATLANMLGKDPINNMEDRQWLLNRLYGYFGLKLASNILGTIVNVRTMGMLGKNAGKTGGLGKRNVVRDGKGNPIRGRDGKPLNPKEVVINPKKYPNSGHGMPKPNWEDAFGDPNSKGMGITVPSISNIPWDGKSEYTDWYYD